MANCKDCGGHGTRFILRRGNPFLMRIEDLARRLEKVTCWTCQGTGKRPARINRRAG